MWHGARPDDTYWADYWESASAEEIAAARSRSLRGTRLGALLAGVLPASGRIVEAGCGPGYWVVTLRAAGYDVVGVERSPAVVEAVHAIDPTIPIEVGDVRSLDLDDSSLAGYLSFGVIEHFPEGPQEILREAHRVLQPGGIAVFTVPFYGPVRRLKARLGRYDARSDEAFYQYGFVRAELVELLAAAGFEAMSTRPLDPHRMLREESRLYEALVHRRGARFVKATVETAMARWDGHTVAVVARRPPATTAIS